MNESDLIRWFVMQVSETEQLALIRRLMKLLGLIFQPGIWVCVHTESDRLKSGSLRLVVIWHMCKDGADGQYGCGVTIRILKEIKIIIIITINKRLNDFLWSIVLKCGFIIPSSVIIILLAAKMDPQPIYNHSESFIYFSTSTILWLDVRLLIAAVPTLQNKWRHVLRAYWATRMK